MARPNARTPWLSMMLSSALLTSGLAACSAATQGNATSGAAGGDATSILGDGGQSSGGGTTAGPSDSSQSSSPNPPLTGTGGSLPGLDTGDPGDGCAAETRMVYVVSREGHLYRFDPSTLNFQDIGAVQCPVDVGISPRTMAVDRDGQAWTTYSNGSLYKIDTKTAACQTTNFQRPEIGFRRYGMGFASKAPGSTEETLYVGDDTSLGAIDLQTLVLSSLGDFQEGMVGTPELTGTGDGELYGLFFGYPMTVRSISPSTLALGPEVEVGPAEQIQAYAFAFWGGSFWVFIAGPNASSSVTKLDRATGASTKVLENIGFSVVGAGVSTCAPTKVVIQ